MTKLGVDIVNKMVIVYGVLSVITLIMFITTAALFVTSRDVPAQLTQIDALLLAYWLGAITPTPNEVSKNGNQ